MPLSSAAAVFDISPDSPTPLFGYPYVKRLSTGVHDPLLASVLFLRLDDGTEALLISLDLLLLDSLYARSLRRAISQSVGIPEGSIFIACTHTHSGPVTMNFLSWGADPTATEPDSAYLRSVQRKVVKAARDACARAVPAELAWGSADVQGAGGNRLDADGPTDPECGILLVRSPDSKNLIASVLVYGMHPTVLHEDSTLISADFPYYAREAFARRFQPGLPVLWFTGPCGDQSPRRFVRQQTFAEAKRLGEKIAEAAIKATLCLPEENWDRSPALTGCLNAIGLPRRRLPDVETAEHDLAFRKADYERLRIEGTDPAMVRTAECAVFGAAFTLELARAAATDRIEKRLAGHQPIEIQLLRLGGACLAGIPGEIFVQYGLDLKHRSPIRVFPVSLVNGELEGYIVTPEAAAAGGYEAGNSLYAPEAGSMLVNALVELAESGAV